MCFRSLDPANRDSSAGHAPSASHPTRSTLVSSRSDTRTRTGSRSHLYPMARHRLLLDSWTALLPLSQSVFVTVRYKESGPNKSSTKSPGGEVLSRRLVVEGRGPVSLTESVLVHWVESVSDCQDPKNDVLDAKGRSLVSHPRVLPTTGRERGYSHLRTSLSSRFSVPPKGGELGDLCRRRFPTTELSPETARVEKSPPVRSVKGPILGIGPSSWGRDDLSSGDKEKVGVGTGWRGEWGEVERRTSGTSRDSSHRV